MHVIRLTLLIEIPDEAKLQVDSKPAADPAGAAGAAAAGPDDAKAIKALHSLQYDAPEEAVATYGATRCLEVCAYVRAAGERIKRPGPYINKMLHDGLAVPRGNETPKRKET
jgi:hypothetical protein